MILKKYNIDDSTEHFVQVGGHAARLQAIIAGRADASLINTVTTLRGVQDDKVIVLTKLSKEFPGLGYSWNVVRTEELSNPQLSAAFQTMTEASIRAVRFIMANPDESAEILHARIPDLDVTFLKAVVRDLNSEHLWGVDGGLDPAIEQYTADLYTKLGSLKAAPAPNDVLDPRFVEAALKKLGAVQKEITVMAIDPPAPMVVYEGVSKFFPIRVQANDREPANLMVALDRINATVRKGELVTLLGPSGCGKTTLLRLTAGLVAPDEGSITIAGSMLTKPRKDACMVFQNFGLLPWRTVEGNVEFPLEIDGVTTAERREVAQHFIDLVGLAPFRDHFPHELSGGMQQRVGIARALMRRPILIFMDEPFGALDAQTREQLQDDFLKIWSQTAATVIFVTHSIDEALLLSDRIFVFATGPGRIQTIVESPVAAERLAGDVHKNPAFATCRADLRQLLRSDAA